MKAIAVEIIFIFILSMIGAIIFLLFFTEIRSGILNLFKEKPIREDFEIEIIEKDEFNQKFLLELLVFCTEKANNSKLKIRFFPCYYLISKKTFENIKLEDVEEIRNIKYIDVTRFNSSKNYLLIIYEKKNQIAYFLN